MRRFAVSQIHCNADALLKIIAASKIECFTDLLLRRFTLYFAGRRIIYISIIALITGCRQVYMSYVNTYFQIDSLDHRLAVWQICFTGTARQTSCLIESLLHRLTQIGSFTDSQPTYTNVSHFRSSPSCFTFSLYQRLAASHTKQIYWLVDINWNPI